MDALLFYAKTVGIVATAAVGLLAWTNTLAVDREDGRKHLTFAGTAAALIAMVAAASGVYVVYRETYPFTTREWCRADDYRVFLIKWHSPSFSMVATRPLPPLVAGGPDVCSFAQVSAERIQGIAKELDRAASTAGGVNNDRSAYSFGLRDNLVNEQRKLEALLAEIQASPRRK